MKQSQTKISRRSLLKWAAGASVLPTVGGAALAQQAYPSRSVRIIVAQTAGSGSDAAARMLGQWLSEHLGQPFVVENLPGAGGNIATAAALRAPADGYTLLLVSSANTVNATLYSKLSFDFIRDVAPIAGVFSVPMVMVVHPSFPAKSVPEFIAYAKANPGKINMASAGIGSAHHVTGELFKFKTGVDMVHVPYRGSSPAVNDLVSGQVQVMFDVTPTSGPLIKGGKLRALAVAAPSRVEMLPDIPPMSDYIPGFEASAWIGFGAPAGTPQAIIERLGKLINEGLADPKIKARIAQLGATPLVCTPDQLRQMIVENTEKWATVIRAANINLN